MSYNKYTHTDGPVEIKAWWPRGESEPTWERMPVLWRSDFSVPEDFLSELIRGFHAAGAVVVRWNYVGLYQGHYSDLRI